MVYGENEGEYSSAAGDDAPEHVRGHDEVVDKEVRPSSTAVRSRAGSSREPLRPVEVMAKALLEWETIDAHQIDDILLNTAAAPPSIGSEATAASAVAAAAGRAQPVAGGERLITRSSREGGPAPFSFDRPFGDRHRERHRRFVLRWRPVPGSGARSRGLSSREGAVMVDVGGESTPGPRAALRPSVRECFRWWALVRQAFPVRGHDEPGDARGLDAGARRERRERFPRRCDRCGRSTRQGSS